MAFAKMTFKMADIPFANRGLKQAFPFDLISAMRDNGLAEKMSFSLSFEKIFEFLEIFISIFLSF